MHRILAPTIISSLFTVFLLLPSLAVAETPSLPEPEAAEATSEQLDLNERAVEAMVAGNPGRAVALLTEAQRLGELNILALNLGRAYHAAGNCEMAREILESVPTLPAVDRPAPERVNERAAEYLADVDETCEEDEEQTDLAAPDPQEQPGVEKPPVVEDEGSNLRQIGLYTAISGGVVALAGGGLHMTARMQRNDAIDRINDDSSFNDDGINTAITQAEVQQIENRANTLDTIALGSAIVGGAALAVGSYLFLTNEELSHDEPNLSFYVGDDAWSVNWTLRF